MSSIRDFVISGKVGQLWLGLSRQQTIGLFGLPADWLGKASIVRKRCSYEESELWFYYQGCVGIRFNDAEISQAILLYPEHFKKCPKLFGHWPFGEHATMGEWRKALVADGIVFHESDPKGLNYWIVAEQTCVAFGFPTEKSKTGYDRSVEILAKYSDVRIMLDQCKFIGLP